MRHAPQEAPRVLVFGDDCRSFLAVVRSLGRQGIRVHAVPFDPGAQAVRSRYVTRVHELPVPDRSERWIEGLELVLRQYKFDLLIPCCDRSTLNLHAYRHRLKDQRLALPDDKVLFALFDKYETKKLAERLCVPAPRGRLLAERDTVEALLGEFGLPLVIKPRRSYYLDGASRERRVGILRSRQQLERYLAKLPSPRDLLVEEFVDGVGIGVSLIASDGEVLCAFQHQRLQEPPGGGASSARVSEALDPMLLKACRAIVKDCEMTGVAMFEFRSDPGSDRSALLEVNARFWGSLPLPVALKVDFPMFLYRLLVEGKKATQVDYPAGIKSRNLLRNVHHVLLHAVPLSPASVLRLAADISGLAMHPIRLVLGRETSDTFQLDDWRPGALELARIPSMIAFRLRDRRA
jgi:predicted ATP-grasp superfamily ATP-dependent carboligase